MLGGAQHQGERDGTLVHDVKRHVATRAGASEEVAGLHRLTLGGRQPMSP
jgi:hypothetical protein